MSLSSANRHFSSYEEYSRFRAHKRHRLNESPSDPRYECWWCGGPHVKKACPQYIEWKSSSELQTPINRQRRKHRRYSKMTHSIYEASPSRSRVYHDYNRETRGISLHQRSMHNHQSKPHHDSARGAHCHCVIVDGLSPMTGLDDLNEWLQSEGISSIENVHVDTRYGLVTYIMPL